jgi:hypothetical protein
MWDPRENMWRLLPPNAVRIPVRALVTAAGTKESKPPGNTENNSESARMQTPGRFDTIAAIRNLDRFSPSVKCSESL